MAIPKRLLLAADKMRKRAKVWTRAKYIRAARQNGSLFVDIGGGQTFNPGWRTLDFSPEVRGYNSAFIHYRHDLRSDSPLPFLNGEVDLFYSSHTMEHLTPATLRRVLSEMHRSLKPGRGLRIVVPDFDKAKLAFEQNDHHWFDHWQSKSYRKYGNRPHVEAMAGRKRLIYQLAYYVAGHCVNLTDLEARFDRAASPDGFADNLVSMIGREIPVTPESFGLHANWFTASRLTVFLRDAGFTRVVINAPEQSIFPELRTNAPIVRTWLTPVGFDKSYPHISLCADAVKL